MSEAAPRTALVTGGASGIGARCVERLLAQGLRVTVADLNVAAAGDLAGRADVLLVPTDVTSAEDTERMVAVTVERFGSLDVAINSAGVGMGSFKDIGETDLAEWRRITAIDMDGVFFSMRAELAVMAHTGGAIVNVASVMGAAAWRGAAPYVAAKHAVVGLTKTAALEYATRGVRINAIGPGFVDTPLLAKHSDDAKAHIAALHPVGRLATADEVAQTALFLASPAAAFVTGAYLPVDGGYLSQ